MVHERITRYAPNDRKREGSTSIVHAVTEHMLADTAEEGHDVPASQHSWRERRRQRVSKWDRPPDPHDWRYFVGMTGKILITTGLLMFGFVAYQLWGTGIETARIQNKLENQFNEVIAGQQVENEDDGTDVTTSPPSSASQVENSEPAEATTSPDASASASESRPANDDEGPQAVARDLPPIVRGDAFARLEIPKIDKELYVLPGVDVADLKKGPGHYPTTPLPGQLGNASIAGHRTTWGAPFGDLDQLAPGDEIIVTMANGDVFVYEVTSTEIVSPDDSWVIATTDHAVAMLTLTTCHPEYTTKQRMVVHSVLNADKSAAAGVATYYELEPAVPAADEPVSSSVAPTDETDTSADVATRGDGVTTPETSFDESPTVTAQDDETADAFARGWFHDRAAFPQIALWALALISIAIIYRKISRKTRHDSIGILITIAPFVVALYFFYQNVNRLLPPGL
jgi:sortase A